MTDKTKTKPRRGLRPTRAKLAEMHATGYFTPAEVARAIEVSGSCVYTWIAMGALKDVAGNEASKKVGPNVWVYLAAARVKAGLDKQCTKCGCTDTHACKDGCSWASIDPPICSRCKGRAN